MIVMPVSEQNILEISVVLYVETDLGIEDSRIDYGFESGSVIGYQICVLFVESAWIAFDI